MTDAVSDALFRIVVDKGKSKRTGRINQPVLLSRVIDFMRQCFRYNV